MTALQVEIIRTALANMYAQGFFSICVVDNILKLTGGVPERQHYDTLRLLHCINFRDMPKNVRLELPRLIQLVVESPPMGMPRVLECETALRLECGA